MSAARDALEARLATTETVQAELNDLRVRLSIAEAEHATLTQITGTLREQNAQLSDGRAALFADRERLAEELATSLIDRERLASELAAWQERVSTMESTGAWRLRQRLIDFKRALSLHRGRGS